MRKQLSTFVSDLENPKIILIFFLLFVTAIILVNSTFSTGVKNLTQTFGYSPEKAYEMINNYGDMGRQNHIRVLFADIILVILYTVLFSTSIYFTFTRLFRPDTILLKTCLLPFALAGIQLMEVIGVFILLVSYPTQFYFIARITNALTMVKFILTYACMLIPISGFSVLFIKWILAIIRK